MGLSGLARPDIGARQGNHAQTWGLTMKLKRALPQLIRIVVDEAERNSEFARKIEEALGLEAHASDIKSPRPPHRRAPAILDPIDLARQGEHTLRARLAQLSLEQLKDIVADYGMDPGKLV